MRGNFWRTREKQENKRTTKEEKKKRKTRKQEKIKRNLFLLFKISLIFK